MNTQPLIYSQLPINEYEHSTINLQSTTNQWIWTLDHQFTVNYQSMNMKTQPLINNQLSINEYEHSAINEQSAINQ
jgi:hypothetical protein